MKLGWICLVVISLSGCATNFKGEFDCPAIPKSGCKNVMKVNEEVEKKLLAEEAEQDNGQLGFLDNNHGVRGLSSGFHVGDRTPRRSSEELLTIWIAPYEDGQGIYHQVSLLTAVVKPATWE